MKLICLVVSLLVVGCSSVSSQVTTLQAEAPISGPGITGNLKLTQGANGLVWVNVDLQGDPKVLMPGLHGVHIHEKGSCQESDKKLFSSAGGHFDPGPFGSSTPVEANHPYHMGDLPNINVTRAGTARLDTATNRFTLSAGPVSLFDSDGSAIVVHQLPDQIKAGGTAAEAGGSRLACGVIQKVKS